MLKNLNYIPYTPKEVADVLGIYDDEELSAQTITADMLSGDVPFEEHELYELARHKSLSVKELIKRDPSFHRYGDHDYGVRLEIARKLISASQTAEFAVEICGLSLDDLS